MSIYTQPLEGRKTDSKEKKEKGVWSIPTRQTIHRKSRWHFLTVTPKMVHITLNLSKTLQIIITGCSLQVVKPHMIIKGCNFED